MRIASVTLTNYRSFGPEPTTIALDDLTAFVGSNATGKTAVLAALAHVFGMSSQERRLVRSDFHVPLGQDPGSVEKLSLLIELRIEFPELKAGEASAGVPECFNHMSISEKGREPFCRVRLAGTWTHSNLSEGDIEERLSWVQTANAEVDEHDLKPVRPSDRNRIHVLYVPAARDPSHQLRNVAGTLLSRVLDAVRWSDASKAQVTSSARATTAALRLEGGIALVESLIGTNWKALQDDARIGQPYFEFMRDRLEDVLRRVEVMFGNPEDPHELSRLSDGLRSLFYFALVAAVFDLDDRSQRDKALSDLFAQDRLDPPVFTVFAVEEPENHLAPHYLGRVMLLLMRIAKSAEAQVVVTSHSASILRRVEAEHIRHFRLDPATGTSRATALTLPPDAHEASKFVRQAVQAFPELYFSRLVVLCEGDSEGIILPRVAAVQDLVIDAAFVSVVPLGGRHVNHFWRLLHDLEIPYVTLLDLDIGRTGAGWGRIKYVCGQLMELGMPRDTILRVKDGTTTRVLTEDEFAIMHTRPLPKTAGLYAWVNMLEGHDVFFSAPLDVDLLMLSAFPGPYQGTVPAGYGPRTTAPGPAQTKLIDGAMDAVLGEEGVGRGTYDAGQMALMPWYRYLFLQQGKPATHLLALAKLSDEELVSSGPPVLGRLIQRVKDRLASGA